ncbi:hypothetical protein MB84_31640 (plasmid) [Pandoraea oxalativorans]|uniref:Uncharacterized protein n=1 Tax=Pandoraea oxalativorans TaxID=573737 RepID=A0A192B135_9BURK|nr:hypothetical protein MB84_31640 [Pandoraea oxalativorans]
MAVSSAVAGRQGRIHLGSGQAVGQLGPPYGVVGIAKSRASACASQPGTGQAGGQVGPFVAEGKQGNGVIASSSLWQTGV